MRAVARMTSATLEDVAALFRVLAEPMRLRLLKIGAQVRLTARKIWISLATGHPAAGLFGQVYGNLTGAGALPG